MLIGNKMVPKTEEYNLMLRALKHCTFDVNVKRPKKNEWKDEKKENLISSGDKNNVAQLSAGIDSQSKQSSYHKINGKHEENKSTNVNIYNASVLQLRPDQVHVIDELKIVGKSIEEKINKLEWWQDLDENIDKVDVLMPLAQFKPELKEKIEIRKVTNLLTNVKQKLDNIDLVNDSPHDRLELVGSVNGVLSAMKYHNTVPDTNTFALLLEVFVFFNKLTRLNFHYFKCAANDVKSENELIEQMKKFDVKISVDFCSVLIKRRAFRRDRKGIEVRDFKNK